VNRSLPPWISATYSDEEAAIIAGYLIRMREGTLQALQSGEYADQLTPDIPDITGKEYYRHAEAYSRWLLYWIGYPVAKNEQWSAANMDEPWPTRTGGSVP
jgi:hypothetical protein